MDVTSKITVKFWNGVYYCSVVLPDGNRLELCSQEDPTFTQWQEKIEKAWEASQVKPLPDKVDLSVVSNEEIVAEFKRRGL